MEVAVRVKGCSKVKVDGSVRLKFICLGIDYLNHLNQLFIDPFSKQIIPNKRQAYEMKKVLSLVPRLSYQVHYFIISNSVRFLDRL